MQILRYLPRFRRAARALTLLEERESWSRHEIESYQLERLNSVWTHATQYTAHYRKLKARFNLPPRFHSLTEFTDTVPSLTKDEVRNDESALLSERSSAGMWRYTSGSTGSPMRFYWSHRSHQEVLRARYRFYAQWGIDIFDRTAFFWGAEQRQGLRGLAARLRQKTEDRLRNRLRVPAYRLDRPSLLAAAREVYAFEPSMLYGLSHAVMLFATEWAQLKLGLKNLRAAVLTGEPASESLCDVVRGAFNVPVVIEYGATECGLIAGQAPGGELRVREDLVFVETVPATDGRFDILLTVLVNPVFPLIRYRIGDSTADSIVRQDRGFAILPPIVGRTSDVLFASDGKVFHSAKVDNIFESGKLARVVRRYHIEQEADGSVSLFLEPIDVNSRADAQSAAAAVQRLVGAFPVKVVVQDRLRTRVTGKYGTVKSRYRTEVVAESQSNTPAPLPHS